MHTGSALAQPAEKLLLNTDKQWYYPGEHIRVGVNSFNACRNRLSQLSSIAYIEVLTKDGRPIFQSKLKITDAAGNGSVMVDENTPTGNYTVVAYTNWMKNFGAQAYAQKQISIINPVKPAKLAINLPSQNIAFDNNLKISSSQNIFSKRAPVTLDFTLGKPARLTVSVLRIDDLEKGSANIYMSSVQDPCSLPEPKKSPFIFENKGHIVSGKLMHKQSKLPAPGINAYLSVANNPNLLFMSTSDSVGTVHFDVGEIYGQTEFIVQADASSGDKYIIEVDNPYTEINLSVESKSENDVFVSHAKVIDESIVVAQVQSLFAKETASSSVDAVRTTPFYGKPDGFFVMDDFVKFRTVEELLREYIVDVGIRKSGNKSYPVIFDQKTQTRFKQAPLILVNGVPIFDFDRLMKLNPDDFSSIAVVSLKYVLGKHIFHGIVDVRLKKPLENFAPGVRVINYDGFTPENTGALNAYSTPAARADRKPDFRNVLYWNPALNTDNNGNATINFFTSDLEGNYVVEVQAITADGAVSFNKSFIEVK